MRTKRARCDDAEDIDKAQLELSPKRPRLTNNERPHRIQRDLLSPLSDELLLRVLSFLSVDHLLFSVSSVSRRFHQLACDSQIWKAHYYARFVLPRAMRIPGFRDGPNGLGSNAAQGKGHKLHYSGRRRLWADGRRGGIVWDKDNGIIGSPASRPRENKDYADKETADQPVNWKRQYKIRHNWSRGKCAVEELRLGEGEADMERKVLVKVIEGIAITADANFGLRAWDLKTRATVAHAELEPDREMDGATSEVAPSCIAVDEGDADDGAVTVAVGCTHGGFAVWKLHVKDKRFEQLYQHPMSRNGELVGMAFSFPYLLTATRSVLVSLYTFDIPTEDPESVAATKRDGMGGQQSLHSVRSAILVEATGKLAASESRSSLPSPYLLTSLKSHTSRAPLALSIRATASTTIASIAYTFSSRSGWSIGMQDLHIRRNPRNASFAPDITTTRLAYTNPVDAGPSSLRSPAQPTMPPRGNLSQNKALPSPESSHPSPLRSSTPPLTEPGPKTLCYTHPYLLAALPDNTLILHLVTSTATALTLSPGIRLWGHTSGISDAEITSRGKAVSVSERGDEMRVWELEGGSSAVRSGVGSGRSVEIRAEGGGGGDAREEMDEWEERRNWVGFDDEMVIVLKEGRGGRDSLLVYDFT